MITNRIVTFLRNLNYLSKHSLWKQRESDIVYLTNKILDDARYEYDLTENKIKIPTILDPNSSLDLILKSRKSFIRTGDGEIKIILGINQPFQKYEPEVDQGLRKILSSDNNNFLVGINRNYYISGLQTKFSPFYRRHAYDYRQVYAKFINENVKYLDSTLTGYPLGEHNSQIYKERYNQWKTAFQNRKLIIVCGKGILDKLTYNIFELAHSTNYIYGPRINAWDEHEELISQIKDIATKDHLIVFILGMAGKVMISELAEQGYTCWDVGHLAKYYDAFMKGIENSQQNIETFYAPD